jgi:hypothetical protein
MLSVRLKRGCESLPLRQSALIFLYNFALRRFNPTCNPTQLRDPSECARKPASASATAGHIALGQGLVERQCWCTTYRCGRECRTASAGSGRVAVSSSAAINRAISVRPSSNCAGAGGVGGWGRCRKLVKAVNNFTGIPRRCSKPRAAYGSRSNLRKIESDSVNGWYVASTRDDATTRNSLASPPADS